MANSCAGQRRAELPLTDGGNGHARILAPPRVFCRAPRRLVATQGKRSQQGQQTRRYLLDFGFTPDVYANNLNLLEIDVSQVDALIISHGHYNHVGGLMGFLEQQRPRLRKDMRLYTGGEDDFATASCAIPTAALPNSARRWTAADYAT